MKNSKKLFLILAGLFFLVIIYISYDIASKTTYPGSKGNLKERIAPSDTTKSQQKSSNSH
ncbi:hypothetical protein QQ020_32150 [Fulvivirgaceae bacterium BMA12]|uniref:Uncharacterized protein n=1 Tax=Agaribacillus aureus TaxID=3051825 RepID=A0ABT8LIJ3_9BACT|nr:hypothetical protein [Fulvivirgaceae bacterium BMA12]